MIRIATLLALVFFVLSIQIVTACTCYEFSIETEYENCDFVVEGQVISSEADWMLDSFRVKVLLKLGFSTDSLSERFMHDVLNGFQVRKTLFKVDHWYKNQRSTDTLVIYTNLGTSMCGFNFREGHNYIVYGNYRSLFSFNGYPRNQGFSRKRNIFYTGLCNRTQESNSEERKKLEAVINGN